MTCYADLWSFASIAIMASMLIMHKNGFQNTKFVPWPIVVVLAIDKGLFIVGSLIFSNLHSGIQDSASFLFLLCVFFN